MHAEDRIRALEEELVAARRTIDALIRRAEREVGTEPADRFAVMKAMASLEDVVAARAQELQRSEAHFRALWDHSPDMLLIVGADGRIREHNTAALAVVGGRAWVWELFENQDAARGLHERGFEDAGLDGYQLSGGREVLIAAAPFEADAAPRRLVVLRDVTAWRAVESELESTRALASLGQFATSVANSINNPLAVILGRIELLDALGEVPPETLREHLAVLADHAQRISGVIDAVLSFARPSRGQRERVALQELLEDSVTSCGRRLGLLRVDVQTTGKCGDVHGDRVQLEQALVAIIGGLAEALHRRGRLRIELRREGDRCMLSFFDPGHGRPPRGMHAWFEPPEGGAPTATSGLHMGMLMAANILREHGGWVQTAPANRDGELVRAELPCYGTGNGGRQRRVLVVDSDQGLADELGGMLALDPVQIVSVRDEEQALAVLGQEPMHLILSSVALPDGSGLRLRASIAQRWPGRERRVVLVVGAGAWGVPGVRSLRRPLVRDAVLDLLQD